MARCMYLCDGCGKQFDVTNKFEPPPASWLFARLSQIWRTTGNRYDAGPWSGSVVACSSDCVSTAKANVKQRAQEAVDRHKKRIDDAEMIWGHAVGKE